MFVFQNNFWVNLHQFLRGEIYRRQVNARLGLDPASLSEADRAAWASALHVLEVSRVTERGDRAEPLTSMT